MTFRRTVDQINPELPPLLVVAGTNATGKSDLAVALAVELGGEIVSADSRQLYKGLDLGSGKLPLDHRRDVPHHLIDIADPGSTVSLHEYLRRAHVAIAEIHDREHLPILVGGTGLYIRAVALGYELVDAPPLSWVRELVESSSQDRLTSILHEHAPAWVGQVDARNRRRLTRAIEHAIAGHTPAAANVASPRYRVDGVFMTWPPAVLRQRIEARVAVRMAEGMVEEVEGLLDSGVARDWLWSLGLEYRLIVEHLETGTSRDEFVDTLITAICQFARKQRSWFERDTYLTGVLGESSAEVAREKGFSLLERKGRAR